MSWVEPLLQYIIHMQTHSSNVSSAESCGNCDLGLYFNHGAHLCIREENKSLAILYKLGLLPKALFIYFLTALFSYFTFLRVAFEGG